ncbi:MAG: beta-lactamase family protein [Kordiimonadaceae bacterium]|nr:beta-lactamase family protein [Kordiimonadaceae bacterium]
MKKILRRIGLGVALLVGLFLILVTGLSIDHARFLTEPHDNSDRGSTDTAVLSPPYETAVAEARVLIASFLEENRTPGFSIAVGYKGKLVWAEAEGYADLTTRRPTTTETKFDIGSIAKPLTAIAAMRLVEKGTLSLDRPITAYVPTWPTDYAPITVRQLLSHQAGIRHYGFSYKPINWSHPSFPTEGFWDDHFETSEDALVIFNTDPLLFEPDSGFSYSTYGYTLASAAMAGAAGKPFLQILEDELIKPFGLKNTGADYGLGKVEGRATGYSRPLIPVFPEDRLIKPPHTDHSYKWAGGGMVSTPTDLVKIGMALIKGDLLSDAAKAEMLTRRKLKSGDLNAQNYALGWRIRNIGFPTNESEKMEVISHGGSPFAGQAMILIVPEADIVVALALNAQTEAGSRATWPLAARIARIFEALKIPANDLGSVSVSHSPNAGR